MSIKQMIEEARQPLLGTIEPRRVTAEMENAFYAVVLQLDSTGRFFWPGMPVTETT